MNKDSKMGRLSVANAYPGDDVVDIIGVDISDQWPAYPTQRRGTLITIPTQNGGPRGLGPWLAFA